MIVQFFADEIFVDELKQQTGEATASGAYKTAAYQVAPNTARIAELERQLSAAHAEAQFYKGIVNQARNAATMLLDNTAQEYLFNG